MPIASKNLITPYYGDSETTDGRGLQKKKSSRADFLTTVLDIPQAEIQSIASVSSIIVTEKNVSKRLMEGISIAYGNAKRIDLLDIVTASYFTDGGEYQYKGNSGKNDPILKITGKVSTARELIIDKNGNKAVGFVILGSDRIAKGKSEFDELLRRKSLQYIAISLNIDAENAKEILGFVEGVSLFACTKEFLKEISLLPQENNQITNVLYAQLKNGINKKINKIILPSICTYEEYHKAKEALFFIRKHNWDGTEKDDFIIGVYSLLNLFTTAVFPLSKMKNFSTRDSVNSRISTPEQRLESLLSLACKMPNSLSEQTISVLTLLEKFERQIESQKYEELKKQLNYSKLQRIAVIVPKAYYAEILEADNTLLLENVTIVTANRFDNSAEYDEIIVAGDFTGKRFDIFRTNASSIITVLLYDYEQYLFQHRAKLACDFETHLDKIAFGQSKNDSRYDTRIDDASCPTEDELTRFGAESADLDCYIDKIKNLNVVGYAAALSSSATVKAEAVSIGSFVTGEKVFFSKYYKAFVFEARKGTVTEMDVENLTAEDTLVFTKRDTFTKNIVDNIFESLIESGNFSLDVQEAEVKSKYWKLLLKEYMSENACSYRDVSKKLSALGCKRHEVTIRTWLNDDCRIIGPRDEEAFAQIAALTGNSDMKTNYKGFYEACRLIRHKRREILNLIGQAITDKLRGNLPQKGSLLKVVYDNVEKLAITIELESIVELREPLSISINLINKPLTAEEG